MDNFWQKLERPFFVLAPMYDVTDTAFRQIITRCGKPDVMMTEFVSADGLAHPQSQEKITKHLLQFSKKERPLVAQIFGANVENIEKAAAYIQKLKFDGVDINMGCPDKKVVAMGAGAALVHNIKKAQEIILAAKKGAPKLPISIKIRTGYEKDETEKWVGALLEVSPVAITIHARTKKDMSKVPARWGEIKKATNLAKGSQTLIIGNGDIQSLKEAHTRIQESGADGVMIGRGALANPWIFSGKQYDKISQEEKIKTMLMHAKLFEKYTKSTRNFVHFKKHIKNYVNGFDGAALIRAQLMKATNKKELHAIASQCIK